MRNWRRVLTSVVAVACLVAGLTVARGAEAQRIGPGRQIVGVAVASGGAVPARHVFAFANKIYVINAAGEVWTHLVHDRRVDQAIQLRGNLVGITGQQVAHAFPMGNDLIIVSAAGEVYQQQIRGQLLQPAARMGGATIQDIANIRLMFTVGTRIFAVNSVGDIWGYDVRAGTVMPPRILGGQTTTPTGYAVRFVFPYMGLIFVISAGGDVWTFDPRYGARGHGVRLAGFVLEMAQDSRWVTQMGNQILVIDSRGQVFAHDLMGFRPPAPPAGVAPEGAAPPGAPAPGAPAPAQPAQ